MATTTNKAHRSLAVLDLPKRINVLITYANGVVEGMTGNASFPTPSPALATVTAAIADLQTAENAALARTKGAAATRDAKRAVLVTPAPVAAHVRAVYRGSERGERARHHPERGHRGEEDRHPPTPRLRGARRSELRHGEDRRPVGRASRLVRLAVFARREDLDGSGVDAPGQDHA